MSPCPLRARQDGKHREATGNRRRRTAKAQVSAATGQAPSLFSYSASYRDQIGDNWKIPKNRKLLHFPSLRVATDGMISSWTREIALTHRGFNVDRTWLIYSVRGVEPDLGRKDFP